MSFFGAVTSSLAGVVVLCFAVMKFDFGDILFGRRAWRMIPAAASMLFLGMAMYHPAAFTEGMDTVGRVATEQLIGMLNKIGFLPTTTTPPAAGP